MCVNEETQKQKNPNSTTTKNITHFRKFLNKNKQTAELFCLFVFYLYSYVVVVVVVDVDVYDLRTNSFIFRHPSSTLVIGPVYCTCVVILLPFAFLS
jgi:hypothetical protein